MKSEIKLELLGLNKYEAMAYQALIRLGKGGASEISQNSGVPYGRIYDTLNSLAAKGLIVVIPEKAKKFAPAPPEALEKLLALKQRNLTQLRDEIKKLKQIYVPSAEEPVEIVKGKRNFYKIIQKIPHPKHYNYEFKFTSEVKPEWVRKARKLLQQGVDLRSLVKYNEETKTNIEKWKLLTPKLKQRKFELDNIAGQIADDKTVFFTMVESNTTVLIRDVQFAKLMKKLFESAWKESEEI